ncbi:hypothetical protein SAMN02745157_1500 [Kaistia soli DSM 19436]|uniref:Uncharacterized protein n=1 Tax=Kaistia soli DSM 19436 TaxID=1122133 RepID=A0A1M4YFB1_9HYPH|nr:hypothetical protein [Kaistia soli]SHF04182.1 hypothetical protein SAMN02745157_1500 [Kaistia soli DSM 19436]
MNRAADYIAAVEAEGHSLLLVRGGWTDGRDAIYTNFYPRGFDVDLDRPFDREAADAVMRLTGSLRPRTEAEKQDLRDELIRRGMVA